MTKQSAIPYVSYVADDAGSFRKLSEAQASASMPDLSRCVLVGWQCGFEPLFVAVHSYLPDCDIDPDEAAELALEGLEEIGWFSREATEPDYVLE